MEAGAVPIDMDLWWWPQFNHRSNHNSVRVVGWRCCLAIPLLLDKPFISLLIELCKSATGRLGTFMFKSERCGVGPVDVISNRVGLALKAELAPSNDGSKQCHS